MEREAERMAEELSMCIDALNRGETVPAVSQETAELLNTAAFVQRVCRTVPDQAVISALVDTVAGEIQQRRGRSLRGWLYSGVAGSVAAVLLVFALQFGSMPFRVPEQGGPASEKQDVSSGRVAVRQKEAVTAPEGSAGRNESEKIDKVYGQTQSRGVETGGVSRTEPQAAMAEKSVVSVEIPAKKQAVKQSDEPKLDQAPMAMSAPVAGIPVEAPPQNVMPGLDKRAAVAPAEVRTEPESRAGIAAVQEPGKKLAVLQLPGRIADSVVQEPDGSIRQVFGKGAKNAIIITQKPQAITKVDTAQKRSSFMATGKDVRLNKVVKKINGMEVTVEGRQTEDQLRQIADSLVVEP